MAAQNPAYWTATEAISWLAFGRADRLEAFHLETYQFGRRWRTDQPAEVLELLERMAQGGRFRPSGRRVHPQPDSDHSVVQWDSPFLSPQGPELARSIQAHIKEVDEQSLSYRELAEMLKAQWAERDRRRAAMKAATSELIEAIQKEQVQCFGKPNADPTSLHVSVPTNVWLSGVTIRNDLIEAPPPADVGGWMRAQRSRASLYHDLRLKSAEVMGLPKGSALASLSVSPIYSTGAPGRPTSAHLIQAEFCRRVKAGETWLTLTACARELQQWLQREHPGAAQGCSTLSSWRLGESEIPHANANRPVMAA